MMSSTESVLGSIVSLWRYPVKSMMGEELNASEVTKSGLLGDRACQ
jgi:MOSC domain-containing protein